MFQKIEELEEKVEELEEEIEEIKEDIETNEMVSNDILNELLSINSKIDTLIEFGIVSNLFLQEEFSKRYQDNLQSHYDNLAIDGKIDV